MSHPGGIKTGIARNGRKTASQDAEAIDSFFEQKLARMTAEKAAQIIMKGAVAGKARVLVGFDAHAMHHLAKLTGSRYQDIVARLAPRTMPARRSRRRTPDLTDDQRPDGSALPPQMTTQTRSSSPGT